ncbi:hypothetical protein SAMN06295905_3272 [Devosia lucknowensis]|uniref:DUF2628 domain-containing protein n=1 Tax=Devosia lucknowensis TaxID=1096929 RepID=A0A1Y6G789_9HYPH|nr:DUF2628 domain-containing protein [Devosia lucknowensis]SMQ85976.1 hypothetical protein SAMN06295905_3272 [Devosia lucknowensis]
MTLYAILMPKPETGTLPAAVPEKFSWFATLLPPVHALSHRLWDQLALYGLGVAAIAFAARWTGPDAAIWLYILLAISCGFAAPGALRRALRRRGYQPGIHRFAVDPDAARLSALGDNA